MNASGAKTQPWFLPHFGCGGKAGPGLIPATREQDQALRTPAQQT